MSLAGATTLALVPVEVVGDNAVPILSQPPQDFATLAQSEWDHIMRALDLSRGNLTRAAELLRIARPALQRRLKKAPPPGREEWPYVPPSKPVRRGRMRASRR
jgi:hypothetical protein